MRNFQFPIPNSPKGLRIIIVGGGTGGHLYPGIALAHEFRRRDPDNEILFVGSPRGLEKSVVPREGFPLKSLMVEGLAGKPWHQEILGLLKLPIALLQSFWILANFRPHLVVGVGGYVTGPFLLAAFMGRIPRIIQEQNVFPGTTNRILAHLVNRVAVSFPQSRAYFPAEKVRLMGNPIRREFLEMAAKDGVSFRESSHFHLLVFGGSQGAHRINVAMVEAMPYLKGVRDRLRVVHQTGEWDFPAVQEGYRERGFEAEILPFIYDMAERYRWADLIICRAGATTIAEITAAGKSALLVPFPYAIHNHQEINARALKEVGAAEMILNSDLDGKRLAQAILSLMDDPSRLQAMGEKARELGRTDAAEQLVNLGYELVEC